MPVHWATLSLLLLPSPNGPAAADVSGPAGSPVTPPPAGRPQRPSPRQADMRGEQSGWEGNEEGQAGMHKQEAQVLGESKRRHHVRFGGSKRRAFIQQTGSVCFAWRPPSHHPSQESLRLPAPPLACGATARAGQEVDKECKSTQLIATRTRAEPDVSATTLPRTLPCEWLRALCVCALLHAASPSIAPCVSDWLEQRVPGD